MCVEFDQSMKIKTSSV